MQKVQKLSVVIVAYNEEQNINPLYWELKKELPNCEILFVDDGSTDKTFKKMETLSSMDKRVRVIKLMRNYGQTIAWKAGFDCAKGDIIVTMDADLQNDPKDIQALIEKMKMRQGYDVVSGFRMDRKDSLQKRLFSKISNIVRKIILDDGTRDAGCALKVYKKEVVKDIELFGDLHRYITTMAVINGYKVGEVPVTHHQRVAGKTKYGIARLSKGLLDLMFLRFWSKYQTKPLHYFGFMGLMQYLFALVIFIEQVVKAFVIGSLELGPLLVLAVLFVVTGTLFIMIGFVAEILIRVYYRDRKPYKIETIL